MFIGARSQVEAPAVGASRIRCMETGTPSTVKPVCNDHLYNKIDYQWFIQ